MIRIQSGIYALYSEIYGEENNGYTHIPLDLCETTILEFMNSLIGNKDNSLPSIYRYEKDSYWESYYQLNLFKEISVRYIETPMFKAYQMHDKSIFCIYGGPDIGGYDVENKIIKYDSVDQYRLAVTGDFQS